MGKADSKSLLGKLTSEMTLSGRTRTVPPDYLRMTPHKEAEGIGEGPLEEEGAGEDALEEEGQGKKPYRRRAWPEIALRGRHRGPALDVPI